jgi:peptide/nickel transport system substrate-binding protein
MIESGREPLSVTCILGESPLERLALTVQQQLQAVGVRITWEFMTADAFLSRLESGQFDCALGAVINGPNLLRPYWAFHSGGPQNWGRFESPQVDAALDAIRHAGDDDEYQKGVVAFQRAIVDDPPAIFLAWSQRARAVTTRFEVPAEPGRDILATLSLWRPAADKRPDSSN